MRGQYKLFELNHNLVTPGQPSPSRGQIPKRNKHTKIIDEVI
jgi:hypothetical protein